MKYSISKGERAFVLWMINKIEGVDRTGGRVVARLTDVLELDDMMRVAFAEMQDAMEFELSEIESAWILDQIDQNFKAHKVPTQFAKYAFSLEEKIKPDDKDAGRDA